MKPRAVVVDTNVVVAGLLTKELDSPTALVLDAMLEGRVTVMLSTALISEYRRVLLRPRIRERHGLDESEVDALLSEIVLNAVVREPEAAVEAAPEPGDQHLWDLLSREAGALLVTGDRKLLESLPDRASVVSVASFAEAILRP